MPKTLMQYIDFAIIVDIFWLPSRAAKQTSLQAPKHEKSPEQVRTGRLL
jgi:hypothetical protein